MLPLDPKPMVAMLDGLVDEVLIDRMNYPNKVKAIYRQAKLENIWGELFSSRRNGIERGFWEKGVAVAMCF